MGRKLTKSELKRITEVAKMERRKSGVKKVEKVVHYNMKWQDAIRSASKKVLAERRVQQKIWQRRNPHRMVGWRKFYVGGQFRSGHVGKINY